MTTTIDTQGVPTAPPLATPIERELVTVDEVRAHVDRPAHVLGAVTAEGVAVARLLVRLGCTEVVLHDTRARDTLRVPFRQTHGAFDRAEQDELWRELTPLLDAGRYEDAALTGIAPGDTLVLGQGWYLDADVRPRVLAAIDAVGNDGLVTSMTELYAAFLRGPVAGITGTNGKSTTVALVNHLMTVAGVAHEVAGNERSNRQFLPDVLEVPADRPTLLELSNRQLLQVDWSPQVAAITSLTPDHLEEHGGAAGYAAVKARLFSRQAATDIAIANSDDPAALAAAETSPAAQAGRLVRCGIDRDGLDTPPTPAVRWEPNLSGPQRLVATDVPTLSGAHVSTDIAIRDDVPLAGDHNLRNVAVAVAVALALGVAPDSIAPALRRFSGKSLRLESVGFAPTGAEVYSDIKSTSPEATVAALDALAAPGRSLTLIAGGDDKGLSYTALAHAITSGGVRLLLVPGTASDLLAAALEATGTHFEHANELGEALDRALDGSTTGSVVIVSPAAAGFWTQQLAGKASLRALLRDRGVEAETTDQTAGA